MHRTTLRRTAALTLALTFTQAALADYTIRCGSVNGHHNSCRLSEPGYVSLERKISGADCDQGRTWDYDRREIWVDRGCEADFRVETQDDHKSNKTAAAAAGVLVGAAILGALLQNKDQVDDHKYQDENYYGSRHTSYLPGWMVGTFRGYNPTYGKNIVMTIRNDGRMTADAEGQAITGYVNDGALHVGKVVFDIDQTREGFITSQRGDRHNEVRYRRMN